MQKVILKKGKCSPVRRKHPWILSGAVEHTPEELENGQNVEVYSSNGEFLGIGYFSKYSQISIRMWTFEKVKINKQFFAKKISNALEARKSLNLNTNAFRCVFSEADGLPGIIIDKYNNVLVCQFLTAGADKNKNYVFDALKEMFNPALIIERSDEKIRLKENLNLKKEVVFGKEPKNFIVKIQENGINFYVDVWEGHKTGFYIDQRENRKKLTDYCKGKNVLNLFSYTGAFGIYAKLTGSKKVINVEISEKNIMLAKDNYKLNNIPFSENEFIRADVFDFLSTDNKNYDLVILDPPKFVSSKSNLEKGKKGYFWINTKALNKIKKNGFLFTFSCSGLISKSELNNILTRSSIKAEREIKIIENLNQAKDHIISPFFPESLYLKGFICFIE